MASIERTAYPRLKQNFTKAELRDFYTPDLEEIFFVRETARCDEGEPAAQVSKQYHICRSDLFKLKRRALLALKAALADKPMYARRCPYTRAPRAGPCVLTQHAYLQREASSPVAAPRLTSAISNPSFPYGWCVNSLPSGLTTAEVVGDPALA